MLTIKINWNNSDFLNYCLVQGNEYVVCALDDGTVQLLIDGAKNYKLFGGNRVYVMNDKGATVDTIHVPYPKDSVVPQYDKLAKGVPNLWVDPKTGRTEERIGG